MDKVKLLLNSDDADYLIRQTNKAMVLLLPKSNFQDESKKLIKSPTYAKTNKVCMQLFDTLKGRMESGVNMKERDSKSLHDMEVLVPFLANKSHRTTFEKWRRNDEVLFR